MRILTVGAIKGGTVPVGQAIYSAFKEIGQESDFLDYSDLLVEFSTVLAAKDANLSYQFLLKCRTRLLEKVTNFRPEAILGIAQSPLNNIEVLTNLKRAGLILCYWFVEDGRIFDYWRKYAPCFDHFFTIQKDPFWKELTKMGCRNFHYLPAAFDSNIECPTENNHPGINVSFMGAPYPNRVNLFSKLQRRDFQIYGEEWDMYDNPSVVIGQRRITDIEARMIYQRSLININLHSSLNPDSFGGGDFVNPRTFELAGLGAFQLTDKRELLPLHFDLEEELIALYTWDDMKTAIDYFLDHKAERARFAKKARERVLQEHTYKHRAQKIISILS